MQKIFSSVSWHFFVKTNLLQNNRVFFKVLSSQSLLRVNSCGSEIQYGRQNFISVILSCHHIKICQKDSPHQNIFKLTLSQKSFYVFRKDRQCKSIFLWSPSLDPINIISVRALKAMKVACKILQRSRQSTPATSSYLQSWTKHPQTTNENNENNKIDFLP